MARVDLSGKAIAISGASSGIGLATAWACARAGMAVTLAARRVEMLERHAAEMRGEGFKAIAVACDVVDPSACSAVIDATVREFGGIYAVFANAGYGLETAYHEATREQIRDLIETNFWGSLNLIDPALEIMRRQREGHVLFCSSCLSKMGTPYYAAYSASKAAQDHFARAMRHELASEGIAVSSVHPVGTRTELFDQMQARSKDPRITTRTPRSMMQPPERVAKAIMSRMRSGRGGEVWTSFPIRAAMAMGLLAPSLADWGLAKMVANRRKSR